MIKINNRAMIDSVRQPNLLVLFAVLSSAVSTDGWTHPSYPALVTNWCAKAKRSAPIPSTITCNNCHANKEPFLNQNLRYFCPSATVPVPPSLTLTPAGDRTVKEGKTLNITAKASDLNGNRASLEASPLPPGAAFDAQKRRFTWTPAPGDSGATPNGQVYTVNFIATDSSVQRLSTSQAVRITVLPAEKGNHAPVFDTTPPQQASAGLAFRYTVSAYDADTQQTLRLSASKLPAGASFSEQGRVSGKWTGELVWTPTPNQAGKTFSITFTAKDNFAHPAQVSTVLKIKVK